jgi:predicted N-formylglutamate amidohydrolase
MAKEGRTPICEERADGSGPFVIVCDHASNRVPQEYGDLGLPQEALLTHIAWDPGALAVSRRLSVMLDAPLLWPDASRLIIDCNRDPAAPDLIVAESEGRAVPGNGLVDGKERARRLAAIHQPYHAAIEARLAWRAAAGLATALVAIHSFTPVYLGVPRPWQVGIVFDDDRRLADPVIDALRTDPTLAVGINQPYSPADRVYYTLARHARPRGLPAVMIEIRNDGIADEAGQKAWAERLAPTIAQARAAALITPQSAA